MKKESLLTRLKKKFCNHNFKLEHEDVATLSTGDNTLYRTFVCSKCGKTEVHQFIIKK